MVLGELEGVVDRLELLGQERRFSKGDVVLRRGDPGTGLFIVKEGRVEVSLDTVFGTKSILGIYGPGTILGDIACLDGQDRTADVVAFGPLTALHIARKDVLDLLQSDGRMALLVIEALCQKVRNATDVLELRALTTAKARLASALLRMMDPESRRIRVSQSWLGNYSGLTRENVNRQLRAWYREGVARFEKGEVIVMDYDRLLDAALNDAE